MSLDLVCVGPLVMHIILLYWQSLNKKSSIYFIFWFRVSAKRENTNHLHSALIPYTLQVSFYLITLFAVPDLNTLLSIRYFGISWGAMPLQLQ